MPAYSQLITDAVTWEDMMSYYDRLLTSANSGKVQLSSLMPGVYPAFAMLALSVPAGNAGRVGIGDSSMAALPADALSVGENFTYPNAGMGNPWQTASVYLWFENAGDSIRVRGENLG